MQRRLAVVASAALLVAGAGSAVFPRASSAGIRPRTRSAMGQYPAIRRLLDGDPSPRRGRLPARHHRQHFVEAFSVIGRDTVFTLCDGTDRAIITTNDAQITVSAVVSDNLVINCTNNNSTTSETLKVQTHDVIDNNIFETVTTQSGDPVDKIISTSERTMINEICPASKAEGEFDHRRAP